MAELNGIDVEVLNGLIIGRVEPQIYAFTTETIPNYLKVGDTYRPVEVRLGEWRKHFPTLEKRFAEVAKVDDDTFFRDYAVHNYLERELKRVRLERSTFRKISHYSNEFFRDATRRDLEEAIADIKRAHKNSNPKYQFYRFEDSHIPINYTYKRTDSYDPRPNQKEAIENFKRAIKGGRTNLLMYAVMRFGKSFTSMCCAVEMGAKLVVVVSAKADVKEEWKRTAESHVKFDGYSFLDSDSLLSDINIISKKQKKGEKVVLFLTLQDLQGATIKPKHRRIFESEIDLLLVDETHFGARAEEYGKVLRQGSLLEKEIEGELKLNDYDLSSLEEITKSLNAKVRIHLSGTPYRILMNSEFNNDDIIAFYQFSDIVEDQKKWDITNLSNDDVKEWDNPYYGFPQMIRFAFNPNESSRKRMQQLREAGATYAFSELFRPQSITLDKSKELHKKFKYEKEILDLLRIIDGTENDESLLGFLDYDKIRKGQMCRHLVLVLPYRASCDALEVLIKRHRFKHLGSYELINISGVESEKNYKTTESVKSKVRRCESENKRTITLTVNRMLTGSTVQEWDTMLYLKDSTSPQEYDQAIFRLQNQYVKVLKDPSGDVVKFNMKPQTLLVDFNPDRMFQMQEHKSQIYNVNSEINGNSKLEERIRKELEISPIVVLNHKRIVQVQPSDILDAVRKYANSRSVVDEATSIAIDFGLLEIDTIRAEIERQGTIGSRQGIEVKGAAGEGNEIEVGGSGDNGKRDEQEKSSSNKLDEEIDYRGRFAMYYARILFFAFLTDAKVKSLQEIISQVKGSRENLRIASNLSLDRKVLELFEHHINPFVLSELDYKIQNINTLANDVTIAPIERVSNAMRKFSRLSDAEIVTPEIVANSVIGGLPDNAIKKAALLLDVASKQGEFVYAIYKRFGKEVAKKFYSIPTSKIAYEFTRKVYKLLELNIDHIESNYTSYDFIRIEKLIGKGTIKFNKRIMKFNVIVGNPPYQMKQEKTSDSPIYHLFMDLAYSLGEKSALITPGRFLFNAGKTPKEWNEKMLADEHLKVISYYSRSSDVFPGVDIMGGIVITLRDKSQVFDRIKNFTSHVEVKTIIDKVVGSAFQSISDIVYSPESYRFSKKLHEVNPNIAKKLSKGHLYDLTSNIFEKLPTIFLSKKPKSYANYIEIFGRQGNERVTKWINRKYVETHGNLEYYKVLVPKSNGSGALGVVIPTPLIGIPLVAGKGTGHTQSFISIGAFNTKREAEACMKYIKTKFARLLLGALKVTQDNKKTVWRYVPMQDFSYKSKIDWDRSIERIDAQLYKYYGLTRDEVAFVETMIKPM